VRFGASCDVPVPAQYDGDGRADFAVWYPGTKTTGGAWWIAGVGTYSVGGAQELPAPVG
jgi:hypothetical protein